MYKILTTVAVCCLLAWIIPFSLSVSKDSLSNYPRKENSQPNEENKTKPPFSETILENYFRDRLSTTCAGYALFGEKPLYLDNSLDESTTCIGTQQHKDAIETHEVLEIWSNAKLREPEAKCLLFITNRNAIPPAAENLVLIINRKAFLDVVNNNLLLFQARLGLSLTAEALLEKLLDPSFSTSALFKGNTALLGILLGYGTNNSLMYERGTTVIKPAFASSPLPPPCSGSVPLSTPQEVIERMKGCSIQPSFGFLSIQDELDSIQNGLACPTDSYNDTDTKIPFSYIEDSIESWELLKMYEKAQSEVTAQLNSSQFLQNILTRFNVDRPSLHEDAIDFSDPKMKNMLPEMVAKSILRHNAHMDLACENGDYFDHFIAGMKDACQQQASCEGWEDVLFFDAYQMQLTPAKKNNKKISREFLSSLKPDITWIEADKVGYNVVVPGYGDLGIDKTVSVVRIHYVIKDIEGKVLCGSYKLEHAPSFSVASLIPGLAHGIQGMKKNEVRDIYVHPDYSYGVHSDFGDGKVLHISVELVDMECGSESISLPQLIPVDLVHLQKNKSISRSDLDCLRKKYVKFCGLRTGLHYKKAEEFFTLSDVEKALERNKHVPLDNHDRITARLLRRFDLYLYGKAN